MTRKSFQQWLATYGKAWQEADSTVLSKLFTKDAVYRATPLLDPFRGLDEIEDYWKSFAQRQKNVQFIFEVIGMPRPGTGLATWRTKFTRPWGTLVLVEGVLLADFTPDGLCERVSQWYQRDEPLWSVLRRRETFGSTVAIWSGV